MKLKSLLLIALVTIVFCGCQSNYQPTTFTVASYNLRNANGSDSLHGNGWGQRYPPRWYNTTISIFSERRSVSFIS